MPTAVQESPNSEAKAEDNAWITTPTHGNSKRLCEIHRAGESCGQRAVFVTTARRGNLRRRLMQKGLLPIYHCDHPRHVANAHKQITELSKI